MSHIMERESGRLLELDALRGFAALGVLLFHLTSQWWHNAQDPAWYTGDDVGLFLLSTGHYGVELFFIISGFVILMSLEKARNVRDFVVSRISRLYPAYWSAIAVSTGAAYVMESHPPRLMWAAMNLTMVQSYFQVPMIDASYWTLAVELEFYFAIGLVFAAGLIERIEILCTISLVGFSLLLAAFSWWQFDTQVLGMPEYCRYGIIPYGGLFTIGICLFRLHQRQHSRFTWALLLLAVLYSAWRDPTPYHPASTLQCFGVICGLTAIVWLAINGLAPVFRWPPLVLLGVISYPLYLVHQRIGRSLLDALQRHGLTSAASLAAVVIIVIGLAAAIHIWIETPGRRLLRRVLGRNTIPVRPATTFGVLG